MHKLIKAIQAPEKKVEKEKEKLEPKLEKLPLTPSAPPALCPIWGKRMHWASECRSKFNKVGQPLQRQGNWGKGTKAQNPRINNTSFQFHSLYG